MVGALVIGSSRISSAYMDYQTAISFPPGQSIETVAVKAAFPINIGPIAIFSLQQSIVPIDGDTIIYGRKRRLATGKTLYTPSIVIGADMSVQNRILTLNLPIGVQINRIPMRIQSTEIRRLILRSISGYNKLNLIPRNLDEMRNNLEAIWLLKLYELAVQELREHSLPTEKSGALEVSTPSLYAQALAMGEELY